MSKYQVINKKEGFQTQCLFVAMCPLLFSQLPGYRLQAIFSHFAFDYSQLRLLHLEILSIRKLYLHKKQYFVSGSCPKLYIYLIFLKFQVWLSDDSIVNRSIQVLSECADWSWSKLILEMSISTTCRGNVLEKLFPLHGWWRFLYICIVENM